MRRVIADRLSESYRNAVHVTVGRDVDAEALLTVAGAAEDALGVDVSMLDVLLAALSATLTEHPEFNGTFEDGVHRLYEEHNIGVAVSVKGGLLVPVLSDTGSRTLSEVAAERRRLTKLVQANDHSMSDLRGGTFTISNLGPLGSDTFTPIINPPEVAILGVNRIVERALPAEGTGGMEFRRQLRLDLSFDHRVVDGADSARFLGTLDRHLQEIDAMVDAE